MDFANADTQEWVEYLIATMGEAKIKSRVEGTDRASVVEMVKKKLGNARQRNYHDCADRVWTALTDKFPDLKQAGRPRKTRP